MYDTDTQDPIAEVRSLANELAQTIGLACTAALTGQALDLTGLDRHVGLLCAKSLDLPPDDGRRVRPCLIALSGTMELLSRALATRATPSG
jgi:hypothetical protein